MSLAEFLAICSLVAYGILWPITLCALLHATNILGLREMSTTPIYRFSLSHWLSLFQIFGYFNELVA